MTPNLLDVVTPWIVAAVLLYVMRRLERWLHEHVFKVGWLITKKQRTTTLLYYTFFLPGVFVHEFVRWLVAGILDVRAERAIKLPDEQQIAELKLTFIRLNRNVGELKVAIISIAPLLVGLLIIGFVGQNVLNIPTALEALGAGGANSLSEAVQILTSAPDVWLWVYFVFTIANTMIPSWSALRGWRVVVIAIVIAAGALLVLGVARQIFFNALATPLAGAGNILVLTFAFVIGVDLLVTAVLGTIEAIIERITGDSATFQHGKLIAMTRQERLKQQEQERLRRERQQKAAAKRAPSGPPSIYNLPFPIPDAPGKDLSQTVTVRREEPAPLNSGVGEMSSGRLPPPIITATPKPLPMSADPAKGKDEDEAEKDAKPIVQPPLIVPTRVQPSAKPGDTAETAIAKPSTIPIPAKYAEKDDEKNEETSAEESPSLSALLPKPLAPPLPKLAGSSAQDDDEDAEDEVESTDEAADDMPDGKDDAGVASESSEDDRI